MPEEKAETTPVERTLTIEGLGFGGEGYVREAEGFVSVHHTLPGDVVRARVGPFCRGRAWAEVTSFSEHSRDRVDPECKYYASCTGCSLRHARRDFEQSWKLGELRSILEKHGPRDSGRLPIEYLDPGVRVGHRIRGRFRACGLSDTVSLGLRSTSLSGDVVDIRDCPAQSAAFRAAMAAIGEALGESLDRVGIESVEVRLPSPARSSCAGGLFMLRGDPPSPPTRASLISVAESLDCSIGRVDDDGQLDVWAGEPWVTVEHRRDPVDPHDNLPPSLFVPAPWCSWYHATPGQAEPLLRWGRTRLTHHHDYVLDLCAGVGALSFAILRPGRRILAVDRDHLALRALEFACDQEHIGEIRIRPGKAGTILSRLFSEQPKDLPTAAVVNPMRQPLGDQLRPLAAMGVEQVIYLGPSAVPAAKDLRFLESIGYRVRGLAIANLHPATAQMMLAADLGATWSSLG